MNTDGNQVVGRIGMLQLFDGSGGSRAVDTFLSGKFFDEHIAVNRCCRDFYQPVIGCHAVATRKEKNGAEKQQAMKFYS